MNVRIKIYDFFQNRNPLLDEIYDASQVLPKMGRA